MTSTGTRYGVRRKRRSVLKRWRIFRRLRRVVRSVASRPAAAPIEKKRRGNRRRLVRVYEALPFRGGSDWVFYGLIVSGLALVFTGLIWLRVTRPPKQVASTTASPGGRAVQFVGARSLGDQVTVLFYDPKSEYYIRVRMPQADPLAREFLEMKPGTQVDVPKPPVP